MDRGTVTLDEIRETHEADEKLPSFPRVSRCHSERAFLLAEVERMTGELSEAKSKLERSEHRRQCQQRDSLEELATLRALLEAANSPVRRDGE